MTIGTRVQVGEFGKIETVSYLSAISKSKIAAACAGVLY